MASSFVVVAARAARTGIRFPSSFLLKVPVPLLVQSSQSSTSLPLSTMTTSSTIIGRNRRISHSRSHSSHRQIDRRHNFVMNHHQSRFLDEVEETIQNVFQTYNIITTTANTNTTTTDDSDNQKQNTRRITEIDPILKALQPSQRESVGVAIHLHNRIHSLMKNNDCRRCWLQQAHCICDSIPSLEKESQSQSQSKVPPSSSFHLNRHDDHNVNVKEHVNVKLPTSIHRLFLLMHHKEIGMAVDTAKLLLASFDQRCRLVVGGIDGEFQPSMNELTNAMNSNHNMMVNACTSISNNHNSNGNLNDNMVKDVNNTRRKCMVLFPSDDAVTFCELKRQQQQQQQQQKNSNNNSSKNSNSSKDDRNEDDKWDVIVIDGTWAQARKMYSRYIPKQEDGGPFRVCLSQEAVNILGSLSTTNINNSNDNDDNDDYENDKVQEKREMGKEIDELNSNNGRQLRRHPIKWREVSTLEATRLMIRDVMVEEQKEQQSLSNANSNNVIMNSSLSPPLSSDSSVLLALSPEQNCYDILSKYQMISDTAAKKQLGAPRKKIKNY